MSDLGHFDRSPWTDDEVREWFYEHGWEADETGDWSEPPPITDEMVAFMKEHRND